MSRNRGQTTLDFAIGMSVFLMTTIAVISFVPGMLEPFQTGPQESTVIADRVATQLVESTLVADGEQYVLSATCTKAFFNSAKPDGPCPFDNSIDIEDRLAVSSRNLNVSIHHDFDDDGTSEMACWDDSGDVLLSCEQSTADWELSENDPPPETGSVVVARRVGHLRGRAVEVFVRVW